MTETATRSPELMQWLGDLMLTGLHYSWFRAEDIDTEKVSCVVLTDPDEQGTFDQRKEVTVDDVVRGITMYEEWLDGKREGYPGEWKYAAESAVRTKQIERVEDFQPALHARASDDSYGRRLIEAYRSDGFEGDYDVNTADSVMQMAVLGGIIFG